MVAYYNRVLAPFGLTAQQVMALGILWRKEGVSLGVFAGKMGIGKAAAVTMVKRLEAMGLVTREPHPNDGRLNSLRLTDKARDLAPLIMERVEELEKTVEKALGSDNLEKILAGMAVIRDLDL